MSDDSTPKAADAEDLDQLALELEEFLEPETQAILAELPEHARTEFLTMLFKVMQGDFEDADMDRFQALMGDEASRFWGIVAGDIKGLAGERVKRAGGAKIAIKTT